jgi:hypothetical protein
MNDNAVCLNDPAAPIAGKSDRRTACPYRFVVY